MNRTSRVLLPALGIAAAAALAWAFWPAPVPVEVAQVRRERFEETISEDGRTRLRDRYVVSAPLAGTLLRIALRPGDTVAAGAVVASILPSRAPLLDPRAQQEAEQRVGAAEADLARAAAMRTRAEGIAAQARTDAERSRQLVARGTAPRTRLEADELALLNAGRDLDAARAAVHAAEHELELARAHLFLDSQDRTDGAAWQVRSPVAGQVLRVAQTSEAPVSPGTPLLEIGNLTDLEVVADVLTTDAVRIRPGDPVRIDGWGGETPLAGQVRVVEPGAFTKVSALGVDEQRTDVVIDITTPLRDRPTLGDAYRVEARIVVAAQDDAAVVPAGALFRDRAGWAVFVVVDGRARTRAVTLALRSPAGAAVAQGLSPGDRVILYPGEAVADGVRVQAR